MDDYQCVLYLPKSGTMFGLDHYLNRGFLFGQKLNLFQDEDRCFSTPIVGMVFLVDG